MLTIQSMPNLEADTFISQDIRNHIDDLNFSSDENIQCMDIDQRGRPRCILNPILEIFWLREEFGGNFDRVVMDLNGLWHWEHDEYYPEYWVAENWRINYPDCLSWHYNRPPTDYLGWMEDDCPVYGREVNSLCCYEYFKSVHDVNIDLLPIHRFRSGTVRIQGKIVLDDDNLKAYVNPKYSIYSPYRTIRCTKATKLIEPPNSRYEFWLSVGKSESEPLFTVFYPVKQTKYISVLVSHLDDLTNWHWRNGAQGLFERILNSYSSNLLSQVDVGATFVGQAFEIAKLVEQKYSLMK